jgi:hypothetical protein
MSVEDTVGSVATMKHGCSGGWQDTTYRRVQRTVTTPISGTKQYRKPL